MGYFKSDDIRAEDLSNVYCHTGNADWSRNGHSSRNMDRAMYLCTAGWRLDLFCEIICSHGGQTSEMLVKYAELRRDTGVGMFLAVDEEGGLVARCAKKLGTTKH